MSLLGEYDYLRAYAVGNEVVDGENPDGNASAGPGSYATLVNVSTATHVLGTSQIHDSGILTLIRSMCYVFRRESSMLAVVSSLESRQDNWRSYNKAFRFWVLGRGFSPRFYRNIHHSLLKTASQEDCSQ